MKIIINVVALALASISSSVYALELRGGAIVSSGDNADVDEDEFNSNGCATTRAYRAWRVEYCGWTESRKDRYDDQCAGWERNRRNMQKYYDNCCDKPDPRCAGIYGYYEKDFLDEDFQDEDFQDEDFKDEDFQDFFLGEGVQDEDFQDEDFQDFFLGEDFQDEDFQEDFEEFQVE